MAGGRPRLWFRGKGEVLLAAADGEPAVAPEAWAREAAERAARARAALEALSGGKE